MTAPSPKSSKPNLAKPNPAEPMRRTDLRVRIGVAAFSVCALVALPSLAGIFAHCEPKAALPHGSLTLDVVDNPFRSGSRAPGVPNAVPVPLGTADANVILNQSGKITIEGIRETGGTELTATFESLKPSKDAKMKSGSRVHLEVSEDASGEETSSIDLAESLGGFPKGRTELECDLFDVTESGEK